MGKRKKAVSPRGLPHRLLGMLPDDTLHTLYEGCLKCAQKEISRIIGCGAKWR